MGMKDKHLGVRLNGETLEKLRFVAAYNGRSIARQILFLVNEDIRRFERELGKIEPTGE